MVEQNVIDARGEGVTEPTSFPIVPRSERLLTAGEFHGLAEVPPEIEWFANITNPHTRRAYQLDVRSFVRFLGIRQPQRPTPWIIRPTSPRCRSG